MRLALDPGKTTGVAWRTEAGELQGLQWPGESIWVVLEGFHSVEGITELVFETFLSRPGPAVNLSAPVTIGRLSSWADQYGVPLIAQTPSAAKVMVTNDRLRAAGGWVRSQQHARDAMRHLLLREHTVGELDLNHWPKVME
jgi:hypothetical protein